MSRTRVIGTSSTEIAAAEAALKRRLPASFANWLLVNNSRSLGALTVFPVFDARDPRKTWDSIVRNVEGRWAEWLDIFSGSGLDLSALLPFADCGTGDLYCFDYAAVGAAGEPVVVLWSHESGEAAAVADSFADFLVSADRIG